MILNHINLAVSDVGAARDFLVRHFGLEVLGGNRNMAFLRDEAGLVLSMFKGKDVRYPGTFHIGFVQPDRDAVVAIHQRLVDEGFDVPPPSEQHAFTFYVDAPGGFQVEVMSA